MMPEQSTPPKKRTAVLISGRGSNMMALANAAADDADFPAEIAIVVSNRPEAPGLEWARNAGIQTHTVNHKDFPSREAFEAELHRTLTNINAEIIALAGFMRILTASFVSKWEGRMLNIHPSLLPAFKGLHTHEQAIAAGVKIAGCTAHFVTAEMDAGPIIAQAAVPVFTDDTSTTLADRILIAEHQVYPLALRLAASGEAKFHSTEQHLNSKSVSSSVNHTRVLYSPMPDRAPTVHT